MLQVNRDNWYHLGIEDIKRSTISDANNRINSDLFEGLFYALLKRCKDITPKHKFKFKNPLHTLDASMIELCLSSYDWAKYTKVKGAIKLHVQYNHSGAIPEFVVITDGKVHEITVAKNTKFSFVADSIVSFDKGFNDYKWLYSLEKQGVYFVTRPKKNVAYKVIGQQEINKEKGIMSDETILLTEHTQNRKYPDKVRLIKYMDKQACKEYMFLTNNFKLSASTIAEIYRSRWQIELFFKWIKQHLKIKAFLGTSKNAVLSQVWIAMCYYLLLAYIKYQTKYKYSLLGIDAADCRKSF